MHPNSLLTILSLAGAHVGTSRALPTSNSMPARMEYSVETVSPNYKRGVLIGRASIFDLCFKHPNPPPRVRTDNISRFINIEAATGVGPSRWEQATGTGNAQFQAWTTDDLGTFRGHFRARFNPLYHVLGSEYRWTVSWRRGGTEGCVGGGVMGPGSETAQLDFTIDSSVEYFFTIARI